MAMHFLSILEAAILFPLIAVLLTFPYAVYCYHKYGSVSPLRTFILFSFLFYLQCAYFLVVLPLPDPASVVNNTGPFYQLIPFSFVKDFLTDSGFTFTQPATWLPALKTNTVLQPLFNLLLTVPFGAYLSYYFKQNLSKVVLFSLLLSLFFEITQLSGLYGLYAKPYRLFDVDDLLLNTLGGALGYWFATRVLRFLPSRDRIDSKSRQRSVNVGYVRRLLAYLIDLALITLLQNLLVYLLNLYDVPTLLVFAVVLSMYSIVVPTLFRGATVGKAVVRIRVRGVQKPTPLFWLLFARYMIRNAILLLFAFVSELTTVFDPPYQTMAVLFMLAVVLLVFIDLLWGIRKGRRLLYERLSKTVNVSSLSTSNANLLTD